MPLDVVVGLIEKLFILPKSELNQRQHQSFLNLSRSARRVLPTIESGRFDDLVDLLHNILNDLWSPVRPGFHEKFGERLVIVFLSDRALTSLLLKFNRLLGSIK